MFKRDKDKDKEIEKLNQIIKELNDLAHSQIEGALSMVRELDQHKIYFVCLENASKEEIDLFKKAFKVVKSKLEWTAPNIFVSAKKIEELDVDVLKDLIKKIEGGDK